MSDILHTNEQIIRLAKQRILEGLNTFPVEKMADVKILQDISEACLKQNELLQNRDAAEKSAQDPLTEVLNAIRKRPRASSSKPRSKRPAKKRPILSQTLF